MDGPFRLLVIEDSVTYLRIVKTYLERAGYTVATATSGEEGLLMVNREKPHLVLCDYILPGMNGDEVCKLLKLHKETRHIPVIILTTRAETEAVTTGLDAGADDYFVKSGDLDVLMLRIRNFLARTTPTKPEVGHAPLTLRPQRILAIDDDALQRRYVASVLSDEGYDVVEASTGEQGLDLVSRGEFDLVLVDFIMPGIQGDEVCRRLKADARARDLPVILLTSRGDKKDMIAGLNAGADDYIVKNQDPEVLKSRVKAFIRRKFYQDENRRIQEELKSAEIEAARAKVERDVARDKARLADELADKNRTLEATNKKLRDAQTALVQAEKLASLGQLVAGIAHEINNPLAFVASNMVTIDRDVADLTRVLDAYRSMGERLGGVSRLAPEIHALEAALEFGTLRRELDTALSDAKEGLDRVKNIVLSLRNFSRLDEGEIKEVDIREGIESTLKILGHLIRDRIVVERDYAVLPRVECYPGLLNQVFLNLLMNACQAIEGRGTIRIKTSREGDMLHVAIGDTGRGIPVDLLKRIFDPFFTTKQVGDGTGLGLSTSYGIVQKHGGRIVVSSEEGRGSVFTVSIPFRLARAPASSVGSPS